MVLWGDWLLARGLGIIREETIEGRYRYLTGAIIDGVTYGTIVAVEDIPETIPSIFLLEQNYPNPFNPTTIINYQLPTDNYVTIKVYNILGEEVATLVDGYETVGYKSVIFDGSNMSSGIYFIRMNAGPSSNSGQVYSDVKKIVLAK